MNFHRTLSIAAVLATGFAASTTHAANFAVVDGDTIKSGGTAYRLEGIDTPEPGQMCSKAGGGTWACGNAATERMEQLVIGHTVNCDPHGNDSYGRILAICQSDGLEINATMVREGLAWAFRQYSTTYISVEDEARKARRGVWQADTETPWDYRERRWKEAGRSEQDAPAGCPIKGNINRKGERIYHAPWSPWYERTHVNGAKGERWFCTEAEAIAAGWRAPMWGR